MYIINETASAEIEIKKSKFISRIQPIRSPEEARSIVKQLKKEHPQSRHVVWAFVLGETGALIGRSDDGEPSGTAGNPTLEVLKGSEITNVLITTIRYFGGTKLGTGGLVRAYGESAKETLIKITPIKLRKMLTSTLTLPYHLFDQIKIILSKHECQIENENFTDEVSLSIQFPMIELEPLSLAINEISSGRIKIEKIQEIPF